MMHSSVSRVGRRRLLGMTGFGLMGSVLLAACQSSAPVPTPQPAAPPPPAQVGAPATVASTPAAAAPAGKAAVELVLLQRNTPGEIAFFKELSADFSAKNPGTTVKVEPIPSDFDQVILARLAAGTAGDICRHGAHSNMPARAHQGLYRPIDDLVAADKYDLKQHLDVAVQGCMVKGQLITLPHNALAGWSGIYYVKDLFDEAGVAYPTDKWTYDDVIAAAQKLTKGTGSNTTQWGFWLGTGYEVLITLVTAWGGKSQTEDGTKPTWNDPKTVESLQFHHDVYHKWKVSPANPATGDRVALWGSKKIAMILSGIFENGFLGAVVPPGTKWGVAVGPIGPSGKRGGNVGVNVYPMWRATKNADAAWAFTKFISTKDVGLRSADAGLEPGARSDVWNDPKITTNPLMAPHAQMITSLAFMPIPANGRQLELQTEVQNTAALMWSGEKTVAQGAPDVQRKAETIFAQPAPGS